MDAKDNILPSSFGAIGTPPLLSHTGLPNELVSGTSQVKLAFCPTNNVWSSGVVIMINPSSIGDENKYGCRQLTIQIICIHSY